MNKDAKIVIFVINNTGMWPSYFGMDIANLYHETKKEYNNTVLRMIEANSVENMRNYACRYAMGLKDIGFGDKLEKHDYLVMLDVDHRYDPKFIINLIKHDKDIITGCTSRRVYPYSQTQFKKLQKNIREDSNVANPEPGDELFKIEASGPVGMLIKVDILFKLKFPYYIRKYVGNEEDGNILNEIGSDIYFCEKLKEAGVDIWLDPSTTFPHEARRVFVNRGQLNF